MDGSRKHFTPQYTLGLHQVHQAMIPKASVAGAGAASPIPWSRTPRQETPQPQQSQTHSWIMHTSGWPSMELCSTQILAP